MTISIRTLDGGPVANPDAEIESLRTTLRNGVVTPGQPGYTNKPIFNAMHQRRPSALTTNAYGINMDRLQRIKAQYDPDNLFRLNPNIAPAPTVAT